MLSPTQVATAQNLLQQHAQLTSRLSQVSGTASLAEVLNLLNGINAPSDALAQAQQAISGYFQTQLAAIEGQLTNLGVSWS